VNIEDAGFEIRDVVSWIYGSGFPKSLNIGKAIDKAAGAEREVVGSRKLQGKARKMKGGNFLVHEDREETDSINITTPATDAAKQWDGWPKPACEFFTLARKPLSEKTVAANVLKWGTGGINIDGCRVGTDLMVGGSAKSAGDVMKTGLKSDYKSPDKTGRFPANLIHDGSDEVLAGFPETKSAGKARDGSGAIVSDEYNASGYHLPPNRNMHRFGDKGSAARFFYCPKASKADRNEGNVHPTVKPTALMAYLCRLITPAGGTVLDPFMGSGSTGKAAVREGFDFIGCELDADYHAIAKARIEAEQNQAPEEPDQKELF